MRERIVKSIQRLVAAAMVAAALFVTVAESSAQVIGTFRWRFEPYCNVVTLTVIQQGPVYSAIGTDDDCGFTTGSPATASFFVGGGTVSGNITIVGAEGIGVNSRVDLSLASLSGTWTDNFGNSGSLFANPSSAPGVRRPIAKEAWAFVVGSSGGLHATFGNLIVSRLQTGNYCVAIAKRYSHKAAQATLADPGGEKIVSVGTGNGSGCNPLSTATQDVVPVYVRTVAGVPVDGNFTIVIPLR